MSSHRVNSIISGRNPPFYGILTLLTAMQGHQNRNQETRVPDYSNMIIEKGKAKLN